MDELNSEIEDNVQNKEDTSIEDMEESIIPVEEDKSISSEEENIKEDKGLTEELSDKDPSSDPSTEDIFDLHKLIVLKDKELEYVKALQQIVDNNTANARVNINIIGTLTETFNRITSELFTDQYYCEKDRFIKSAINLNNFKNEHAFTDEEKRKVIKDSFLNFTPSKEGIQDVSGENAIDIFLSSDKNLRRIRLINSGFYIDIQCPSLSDLNELYTAISDSLDEYGYMFGTLFYLFADLEIKRILFDFIYPLITNSNLRNWNKKSIILEAISLNDYSPILMSFGAMMHRNGYTLKSVCPKCGYIEEAKVDPFLLKHHNFTPIIDNRNNYCLNMISSTTEVSLDQVKKYQEELQSSIFIDNKDTINIDGFIIKLQVPTSSKFLKYGDEFNKSLLVAVNSKDKEVIATYMRFTFFRMLSPWIKSIEKYSDDTKKKGVRTVDIKTISKILDHIQKEKDRSIKFSEFVTEFIKRSSLTYTCYAINSCPSCGKEPTEAVNGFVFFDPQKTFFTMSVMKLSEAS